MTMPYRVVRTWFEWREVSTTGSGSVEFQFRTLSTQNGGWWTLIWKENVSQAYLLSSLLGSTVGPDWTRIHLWRWAIYRNYKKSYFHITQTHQAQTLDSMLNFSEAPCPLTPVPARVRRKLILAYQIFFHALHYLYSYVCAAKCI